MTEVPLTRIPDESGAVISHEGIGEASGQRASLTESRKNMEGNIVLALAGGAIGAFVGAAIWATITVYTNYQIGFMAIGVGALVGYLVRILGGGQTRTYGLIGAVFAIVGCGFGNILSGIGLYAIAEGLGLLDTYLNFDFSIADDILVAMFSPIDVLFYAIAIKAAFSYSKSPGLRDLEKISHAQSYLR